MLKNKRVVFISCFNAYGNRIKHIETILKERGYDTTYITSNFDHVEKKYYKIEREDTIQINTLYYSKNFSIKRLLSHFLFSKNAIKIVEKIKPDILYVMLPPNSLAFFTAKYIKRNRSSLIFDIYDLWPETFPSVRFKKLMSIPFTKWGQLRNKNLKYADVLVTECDYFREIIQSFIGEVKTVTLYPLKINERKGKRSIIEKNNELNICYLGSINSIIDIDKISNLLGIVNYLRKVNIHIIGDGEKRELFIELLKFKNIKVIYYGVIYDEISKQEIFDICDLGINMMKDSVCIGLTLKSIDYLSMGLPLLNNIKGDTWKMVEEYGIGLNIAQDLEETAHKIANLDEKQLKELRRKTEDAYKSVFSKESFDEKINCIFNELL